MLLLLRAGVAHHFNARNFEMPMFIVLFCHAGIVGHIFRIFFPVVDRWVRNDAHRSDFMSHMVSQRHGAAANFPGASVVSPKVELLRAVSLREASGDGSGV